MPLGSGDCARGSGEIPVSLVILDTDILIDLGRGEEQAAQRVQDIAASSRLAVSVVTHLELIVGCANKAELGALERFLMPFSVLRLSASFSMRWSRCYGITG